MTGGNGRGLGADWLLAGALAAILTLAWGLRDWAHLSWLILPDTDDMMRLAQVRDWLAGQATNDWTQYRVAPPLGTPMHWSRVADAPLAVLILLATPVAGRAGAELFAVIAWPAILFACSLFLTARIARGLWGARVAPIAVVLGAIALPGTTVFVPGRIDHHALQVVLVELAVLAAVRRPRLASGAVLGAAVGLSLVIGLETAPQLIAVLGVAALAWVVRGGAERVRLAGVAAGLAGVTAPFALFLRPTLWSAGLCDAFTPASVFAAIGASVVLLVLSGATPRLATWWTRLAGGAVLGAVLIALVATLYPACIAGPYGQVDPFLQREFIAHIEEANGILKETSFARVLQLVGLMAVGGVVTGWLAWRRPQRWPRWAPLAAALTCSALLTFAQVRGTYIGTPLAVPFVAGLVLAARRRGTLALVGAWLVSAGLFWTSVPPIVAGLMPEQEQATSSGHAGGSIRELCNDGPTWAAVDRYPPGVAMASTNVAAYLVGATRWSTVGAGYHRSDRGNMAMYRFFLGRADAAPARARAWNVRYVVWCPGDFGELDLAGRFPDSLAARLARDEPPPFLHQLPLRGGNLRLYRLVE